MNPTTFKPFRNVVLAALLFAGCGAEPIPVDLATAAGPCDYGQEFVTEGMQMVIRDGQLTVEPKDDGEVNAMWAGYVIPKGGSTTTATGCAGCH